MTSSTIQARTLSSNGLAILQQVGELMKKPNLVLAAQSDLVRIGSRARHQKRGFNEAAGEPWRYDECLRLTLFDPVV